MTFNVSPHKKFIMCFNLESSLL